MARVPVVLVATATTPTLEPVVFCKRGGTDLRMPVPAYQVGQKVIYKSVFDGDVEMEVEGWDEKANFYQLGSEKKRRKHVEESKIRPLTAADVIGGNGGNDGGLSPSKRARTDGADTKPSPPQPPPAASKAPAPVPAVATTAVTGVVQPTPAQPVAATAVIAPDQTEAQKWEKVTAFMDVQCEQIKKQAKRGWRFIPTFPTTMYT